VRQNKAPFLILWTSALAVIQFKEFMPNQFCFLMITFDGRNRCKEPCLSTPRELFVLMQRLSHLSKARLASPDDLIKFSNETRAIPRDDVVYAITLLDFASSADSCVISTQLYTSDVVALSIFWTVQLH
jgi:hypothetical protein